MEGGGGGKEPVYSPPPLYRTSTFYGSISKFWGQERNGKKEC